MLKLKKFNVLLASVILGMGMSTSIFATEVDTTYAEQNYNTEAGQTVEQVKYVITDLVVGQENVTIENNGESVFLDVEGEIADGTVVNLSAAATWESSNMDVVYADQGRILAIGQGDATVTVSYGDFSKQISVSVLNQVDIAELVNEINSADEDDRDVLSFTTTKRTEIVDRAKAMVELKWTPTKNVRGWKNNKTFYAKTEYTGIPYSQTEYQKGKSDFVTAMKSADFYDNYTRFNIIMPKYGNDCSGFVSFAWGISRKTTDDFVAGIKNGTYAKVGTYDASSPTTANLKTAYKSLKAGDAVVKSGHTFLIASNDTTNSKVYVYEQTPYLAIYTSWTYTTMANDGYMPFTEK